MNQKRSGARENRESLISIDRPNSTLKTGKDLRGVMLPLDRVTPDKLPDPWLLDTEYLLKDLDRVRELALRIPVTLEATGAINSVIDSVWDLQERLRFCLHLHLEGQRAFRRKREAMGYSQQRTGLGERLPRQQARAAGAGGPGRAPRPAVNLVTL